MKYKYLKTILKYSTRSNVVTFHLSKNVNLRQYMVSMSVIITLQIWQRALSNGTPRSSLTKKTEPARAADCQSGM